MADLSVEIRDHVATVTLERPPVNAITRDTMVEIRDVFASLGDDREVRVAIFTAVGDRAFIGGVDLRSSAVSTPEGAPEGDAAEPDVPPGLVIDPSRTARDAMWAITDCAVPVIGAINGPALGAGIAFAACCDILIASDNARFGTTEINVGLLGASSHLSTLVGRHKARELFFTGEQISAAELYRLGALRAVVPRAELDGAARDLALSLAKKSPIALRLAKESMNRVEGLPLKQGYPIEQEYTARLLRFEDSAEARAAFLEKREPEWRWR